MLPGEPFPLDATPREGGTDFAPASLGEAVDPCLTGGPFGGAGTETRLPLPEYAAGPAVVLDVVPNHTAEGDHLGPTPGREQGGFDRLSAFFDLVAQDPVVSRVKVIAEPWDVGQSDSYDIGRFPPLWREWKGRYRLSFGVPLLLGGDELGRTQHGNNNAYCQDNPTTWFDRAGVDEELLAFTRRLIAFRLAHPVFRRRRFLSIDTFAPLAVAGRGKCAAGDTVSVEPRSIVVLRGPLGEVGAPA